ncbi:MAG: MCE family protein [Candidatus Saganbacteria bacterium]|nr:MCE family protein [Candidatus Saganbacteria bacterium]
MSLSTAAKVGILTIIALIALALVSVWKTEFFMVKEGYQLTGSFNNIEGLTQGSEVRFRGFKVGKVMKIDPGPLDIKVFAVIDKNIKVPVDSQLRVSYDGIVGQKYLEVRPGTSEVAYKSGDVLEGVKTSAIVDFVDVGTQNLMESKRILEDIRIMLEDPRLQQALYGTVYAAQNVAVEADLLTKELRKTNQGISDIVADPKFQQNVKGTISETEKTLSSANKFFDSVGKINMRASAGLDIGTRANAVQGDIDIIRDESNYFRVGMGEGPTRSIGLLDLLFTSRLNEAWSYRIGVINNQIGGGVALFPGPVSVLRGDIYDINNPRPNWPKVRFGYEHELRNYMDLALKADDVLNEGNRNFTFGIKVKPPGSKVF